MSQSYTTEPQSNAGPSWDEMFFFNPTTQPFEPYQSNTQSSSSTNFLSGVTQPEPLALGQDLLLGDANLNGFNINPFQAYGQLNDCTLSKLNNNLTKVYLTIWELKHEYELKICNIEKYLTLLTI